MAKRRTDRSGFGGNLSGSGGGTRTFLEFPFTQKERDSVLRYCLLRGDIVKRFRKMVAVGSDIVVAFDGLEATEMMASLSSAATDVSEDADLVRLLGDLHDRFEAKCNEAIP